MWQIPGQWREGLGSIQNLGFQQQRNNFWLPRRRAVFLEQVHITNELKQIVHLAQLIFIITYEATCFEDDLQIRSKHVAPHVIIKISCARRTICFNSFVYSKAHRDVFRQGSYQFISHPLFLNFKMAHSCPKQYRVIPKGYTFWG